MSRDLFRFRSLEAGAILEGGHAKTGAEDDPHPVRRPEAAIEGDGLQRPVASFQHHARRINAGALDELMRRDPGRLNEMSGRIPRAHADDSGQRLQRVAIPDVAHDMVLDARDWRFRIGRCCEIGTEL
jgi:hypothetical protein